MYISAPLHALTCAACFSSPSITALRQNIIYPSFSLCRYACLVRLHSYVAGVCGPMVQRLGMDEIFADVTDHILARDRESGSSSMGITASSIGKTGGSIGITDRDIGITDRSIGTTDHIIGITDGSIGITDRSIGITASSIGITDNSNNITDIIDVTHGKGIIDTTDDSGSGVKDSSTGVTASSAVKGSSSSPATAAVAAAAVAPTAVATIAAVAATNKTQQEASASSPADHTHPISSMSTTPAMRPTITGHLYKPGSGGKLLEAQTGVEISLRDVGETSSHDVGGSGDMDGLGEEDGTVDGDRQKKNGGVAETRQAVHSRATTAAFPRGGPGVDDREQGDDSGKIQELFMGGRGREREGGRESGTWEKPVAIGKQAQSGAGTRGWGGCMPPGAQGSRRCRCGCFERLAAASAFAERLRRGIFETVNKKNLSFEYFVYGFVFYFFSFFFSSFRHVLVASINKHFKI